MQTDVSPVFFRRLLVLAMMAVLAGCATPRMSGPATSADPHYKIGAPYKVNGRWYHPKDDPDYEAVGIASWYGDQFHGRRTANGEIFDKELLSAAHTTLPLPSLVEVKNLENGRSVVVRVNDRGPFVDNRLIDLSRAAAEALGFEKKGLAKVRVRYVGRAELYAKAEPLKGRRRPSVPPAPAISVAKAAAPAVAAAPTGETPADELDPLGKLISEALAAPPPAEIWIAVGAFKDLNALEAARFSLPPAVHTRVVSAEDAGYELQIGPEFDAISADARLAALREAGYSDARIVAGSL